MAAPVAVLSILVTANTKQAAAQLTSLDAKMKSSEGTAHRLGSALMTVGKVGAVGAAAGLAFAVKKAADFEEQMSALGAVTDASRMEMKRFEKQAMSAGARTKFSALEAAKAQTELAKGGLSVRNILRGGLNSALALAAASEMDLADAAATTANAMNLFGLRGKAAMKVADQLAAAANATTADVDDFAMALRQGGSVAKTAGLSFTDTVLTLEALAKAGIKNSDAGTSMKTAYLQLIAPTKKQKELAEKLNLSFIDQQGNLRGTVDLSARLVKATEGMTNAQRAATFKILAGTDGVRTLNALYAAGPDKLEKYRAGLEKTGTAAENARKRQDNLRGDLEKLRGSVETLAIGFGMKLLPALRTAVQDVTKVLSDKTLSSDEKIRRLAEMFAQALGKVAPVMVKAAFSVGADVARGFLAGFRELPLWGKILSAGIIFKLMFGGGGAGTAAFKARGQTAGQAFAGGFRGAIFGSAGAALVEVLGNRLAKSGGILGKIGGVIGRPGASPANALWVKMVPGFGGGVGGKGGVPDVIAGKVPGGKAGRLVGKLFKGVPVLGSVIVGVEIARELGLTLPNKPRADAAERARRTPSALPAGTGASLAGQSAADIRAGMMRGATAGTKDETVIANTVRLGEAYKRARKQIRELRQSGGADMDALREKVNENLRAIRGSFDKNTTAAQQLTRRNFKAAFSVIGEQVQKGRINVRTGMQAIQGFVKTHSQGSKEVAARNFKLARDAIAAQMGGAVRVTDKNAGLIRRIFAMELSNYGFTKAEIRNRLAGKEFSGKTIGAPLVGKRQGGMVVPGQGSGDKVGLALNGVMAARVEPQEGVFVVNRNAMKVLAAFNDRFPRFAGGGIVALGRQLQHQGYAVGEHPAFGGVNAVHAPNSYHYRGMALDVNWPDPRAEPAMLDRLYARLKGMRGVVELLWRVADHFDHLHVALSGRGGRLGGVAAKIKRIVVGGPDSPLRDVLQGATDKIRSAAQDRLDALTMAGFEGGESGVIGGSARQNMAIGRRLAARFGWGAGAQWQSLVELWNRESGWNALARNPSSGAFGIPQALPATKMPAAAQRGDAASQIMWGLQYIAGRYGSPAGALAWHNAHNWYQRGGEVPGLLYGGGARLPFGGGAGFGYRPGIGFAAPQFAGAFQRGPTSLPKGLGRALRGVRQGKTPKLRGRALRRFLDRVKGLGLGEAMEARIKKLTEDAEVYGEYAGRASSLTVTNEDGSVVQGVVYGKTEAEWLTQQLETLFKLRNKLIAAEQIIVKKREAVAKLIDKARKRLDAVADAIREAAKRRRQLEAQLTKLQKHPKKNADAIKQVKKSIAAIDDAQAVRVRERNALKERILPGLTTKRSALNTSRGELLSSLETVQGVGSPMEVLAKLPEVGVLGGQIFDVQMRLKELNEKPTVTDASASESTELLKELLRQANQRFAVSQAQYAVFQNMPFAGSFGGGGVIPGPIGRPMIAEVHGGEVVSTGAPVVNVNIAPGMEWLKQFITVTVDDRTRQQARPARTPLPGRGGGVQR